MADNALRTVQVEALVVMKIVKHCSASFPTTATGSLVGMDVSNTLEITNTFPFPTPDTSSPQTDSQHAAEQAASIAASAPRAKANIGYQNEMIKLLREVNVDANCVGWYMSASMGAFVNAAMIENMFFYQKEALERAVGVVYDVGRSSQGALSLRAFRLSPPFMAAYREGKFTVETIQKSKLRYQDILTELPLVIHNSHLLTSLLHQLPSSPANASIALPPSLSALNSDPLLSSLPLAPNLEILDLSIDPFLEKSCDLLLDAIETHTNEQNNAQYYVRSLAREQAKITAWQAKRKAENQSRAALKQAPLPEDEWQRLFKLPAEPSRLEMILNSRQVEQYARQVDGYAAGVSGKMFGVRAGLLPGEH